MEIIENKDSRFRRQAVQVEEAKRRIVPYIKKGNIEEVDLSDAYGRTLAEALTASHPLPPFPRSGMDGFAIRSADTLNASSGLPITLEVIDNIPCGSVPSRPVVPGTASRIMTGAMVPDGADAVIMLEMVEERTEGGKDYITIKRRMNRGDNVSLTGSEAAERSLLLEPGRYVHAGEIALLAAFGQARVKVFRRPKVAIISTGSELLAVNEPLVPGKIRNSNAYMLAALVREEGGEPMIAEPVSDDVSLARIRLEEAFAQADLVITTGGVSVGDHDILVDLFEQWDGRMLFNKVTMRPGSPTTVGVRDGKLLFALSGNPGACFVGFKLFVRPALLGMQGVASGELPAHIAVLDADFPKVNAYTRFVRGRTYIRDGKIYAAPAGPDQSSIMISIKDADCLIVIPPTKHGLKSGDEVMVLRLVGFK
jgi:molybdopterin molybdotransferase